MKNNTIQVNKLPEWKQLFDKFKDNEYNSVITYAELNLILIDGDIRENKRYVFEKFKKEMLKQQNKAFENIVNEGYRIVNPNEHVRLTNKEIKRAERRARQAVEIILHVDYEKLTDKERAIANLAAARVQPLYAHIVGEQRTLKEEQKYKLPYTPR
jgi:hypothetical protein